MKLPASVMYVANSNKLGGGNGVLIHIVEGLDRSRFAPYLFAPGRGPLTEWAQSAGLPWGIVKGSVPGDGLPGLFSKAARIACTALARRTRIIHAMAEGCYRPAAIAGKLVGAARIVHLGFPPAPGEMAWSLRFGAEAVVGCYQGQARAVEAEVHGASPATRVLAISNGVDPTQFRPPGHERSLEELALRGGAEHVVLIVGHLHEVKGYPWFIRAAALIARELPGCRFLCLGGETISAGYQKTLEGLALEAGVLDRMTFLGWRSDVNVVLRSCDVMALPSLAEGLPLAILEAMACGRPVVATPVGGVSEAVLDGETGILVPPKDPDALSRAILRILLDRGLAERMQAAARARVEHEFSVRKFVTGVQRLYDELLGCAAPAETQRGAVENA